MRTAILLIFLAALVFLIGCKEDVETTPQPPSGNIEGFLAWDDKPERKEWTTYLMSKIDEQWDVLSKAQDAQELCPNYKSMTVEAQKEFWGELFVAMAFYESAWKPDARYFELTMGYYSEGLFQVSVVDNSWSKCGLTKETILQPLPNINCAVLLMSRQIRMYNEIVIQKGAYWAVIKDGNKYQKIKEIKSRIETNLSACKVL